MPSSTARRAGKRNLIEGIDDRCVTRGSRPLLPFTARPQREEGPFIDRREAG